MPRQRANTEFRCFPGVVLLLLGLIVCTLIGCGASDKPATAPRPLDNYQHITPSMIGTGPASIFAQYHIQEVHRDYQKAYLDLITKINTLDRKGKDKDQARVFDEYVTVVNKYQTVVKQINDMEKIGRSQCNSIMRSLVSAVSVYDKRANKKMYKLDIPLLMEEKILPALPKCPRDGEYSIYYKDGRRFLRCSVHGTLKQN